MRRLPQKISEPKRLPVGVAATIFVGGEADLLSHPCFWPDMPEGWLAPLIFGASGRN